MEKGSDLIADLAEYKLGQTVYLKTDKNQDKRILTGILIRPHTILYYLACNTEAESMHYSCEMSSERDVIMATSN